MSKITLVVSGGVATAIGLVLAGYYAMISCATNLADAQRLSEPWCGFSRAYALAGLVLAAMGITIIALGRRAQWVSTDPESGSKPGVEG